MAFTRGGDLYLDHLHFTDTQVEAQSIQSQELAGFSAGRAPGWPVTRRGLEEPLVWAASGLPALTQPAHLDLPVTWPLEGTSSGHHGRARKNPPEAKNKPRDSLPFVWGMQITPPHQIPGTLLPGVGQTTMLLSHDLEEMNLKEVTVRDQLNPAWLAYLRLLWIFFTLFAFLYVFSFYLPIKYKASWTSDYAQLSSPPCGKCPRAASPSEPCPSAKPRSLTAPCARLSGAPLWLPQAPRCPEPGRTPRTPRTPSQGAASTAAAPPRPEHQV